MSRTGNLRYRKRPVVVEAFQMTAERREDNRDWPDWLNCAWNLDRRKPGAVYPDTTTRALQIRTLEGMMFCRIGDWIVRGVKGELYPVRHDIFEATYEPAP